MAQDREQIQIPPPQNNKSNSGTKGQLTKQSDKKPYPFSFCIFPVHVFGFIFEWLHKRMALSATLALIKRIQMHRAPGVRECGGWTACTEEEPLKAEV